MTSLFKIVTVKDEIVVGLAEAELEALGGRDAGSLARALVERGVLSVWEYAVNRGANGELHQAPLRQIGLIAHTLLRVEPYTTPLPIVPHG